MTTWTPNTSLYAANAAHHAVQFYEDEAFLFRMVGDYLADGLDNGQPMIVIATPAHREGFVARLRERGFDHEGIFFADARDTVSKFVVDGTIDEEKFYEVIGRLIEEKSVAGLRLRVYGEMVDLLWRDGHPDAAIRLEELWNELGERNAFSLLCAYPIGNFLHTNQTDAFLDVCRTHGHVIPAETYTPEVDSDVRSRQIAALQQRAAALEAEIAHRKELESALRESLAARRQAEEALRRSERELKDFLENASVALHWVGADGTILWANDAELKLLGYTGEEYVGHKINDFYADKEVIEEMLCRLRAGEEIRDCEVRLLASDGTIKFVSVDSNALFENGAFVHTRCFTRDITDRKRMEQANAAAAVENARLYQGAQEANRAKDEFLATLSHELRTPLTAILGWARLLLLGGLDAGTANVALETIERSARTQAALIDDLLDLSRVVTGKLTLESELVDLRAIVDNAVQTQRLAAEAKSIRLDVRVPDDSVVVMGDATRLQQVIWNLVGNAIKFSDPQSAVTLLLERNAGTARISVRDTGRGIHQEFLPHVFEPFRQAESASTRAFGGLGLGLAIVKYLVELHGGMVAAKSEGQGRGASFEVTLPIAARIAAEGDHVVAVETADLRGMSVLLVDDDSDTRELVRAILTRCGADVHSAASVDAACVALSIRKPDVLVTDIAMPHRDGFSLLEHVRSKEGTRDLPVVALTAFAQRGEENAFHAYIQKPVDPLQFARVIAGLRSA